MRWLDGITDSMDMSLSSHVRTQTCAGEEGGGPPAPQLPERTVVMTGALDVGLGTPGYLATELDTTEAT